MKLLYFCLVFTIIALAILYIYLNFQTQPPEPLTPITETTTTVTPDQAFTMGSSTNPTTSTSIDAPSAKPRIVKISTTTSSIQAPKAEPTPELPTSIIDPPVSTSPKPSDTANEPATSTTYSSLKWGVFAGSNSNVIKEFSNKIDENPDYLSYFVHWGNGNGSLPDFLSDVAYKKDRTLIVFWEASDYKIGGTNQPDFAYRNILAGKWDDYFTKFAAQLKSYEGPIILVPFSELNGNWTPWSGTVNGNTPGEAVAAFQYVHPYFKDIANVKIGWAVNAASVPNTLENQIEKYYPGDEYVDIVGVDGFNEGPPWPSFSTIFHNPLTRLSAFNKPIFIFSFASAEGPNKAKWMEDAFFTQMPKYPKLQAWIWFNQDKERNWLIWSDSDSLEVFKRAVED